MAKHNSAELTVLHVVTIPYSAFSGDVPVPLNQMEEDASRVRALGNITACYDVYKDLYLYGKENHKQALEAYLDE